MLLICFLAVAILCGIIFGPLCANFVDVSHWGNEALITKEFSRIVIGIQVMAAGVALPKKYLYKELKSILVLLGPVMIWMWLSSGLFVWALIPELNFVTTLLYFFFLRAHIFNISFIAGSFNDCCMLHSY